ncbi:hypothetical protein PVAP13_8KG057200 [Panicum virgatum]|uniref:Uncharacterized protein n=1 Tax=Panicum virgatum TaxID=38727 RepID=A0A8T0PGX4_PANVG|nr:hypothetical protein PVAP13_8KG057200 [Panicum virgatum]
MHCNGIKITNIVGNTVWFRRNKNTAALWNFTISLIHARSINKQSLSYKPQEIIASPDHIIIMVMNSSKLTPSPSRSRHSVMSWCTPSLLSITFNLSSVVNLFPPSPTSRTPASAISTGPPPPLSPHPHELPFVQQPVVVHIH